MTDAEHRTNLDDFRSLVGHEAATSMRQKCGTDLATEAGRRRFEPKKEAHMTKTNALLATIAAGLSLTLGSLSGNVAAFIVSQDDVQAPRGQDTERPRGGDDERPRGDAR
jgi:hypothetical protein